MKNIPLIFSFILATFFAPATEASTGRGYDGSAYIFVEGDVEFSVFPDGQFDFVYVGPQTGSQVTISTPNVNVSFNSGYDYEAYVQYDDYGAVVQVESVPIYYDEYGRIAQAGNVDIQYNDRRIVRVGGLHVVYNNYGYFSHCTGAINFYNPYYVYRPWHVYYARPIYTHCVVYDLPYRRYYRPIRYSYHDHIVYYKNRDRVAYHNTRRDFYRPGSRVYDKGGRASINKDYNPNRKNTMVAQNTRSNSRFSKSSSTNSKGATLRNASNNNTRAVKNVNTKNDRQLQRNSNVSTRSNVRTKQVIGNNTRTTRSVSQKTNTRTVRKNSNNDTNAVFSKRTKQTVSTPQRKLQNRNTVSQNTRKTVQQKRTQSPKRETASRTTSSRKSSVQNNRSTKTSDRRSSSRGRG